MATETETLGAAMADADMEIRTTQSTELVEPAELRALMERSDRKAWIQILSHFGALGVGSYGLYALWGSWWAVPLFMIHGTLLAYLYAAQHELSHQTAFETPGLNVFWGHVCGFFGTFPFYFDRTAHMVHHQYTSIRGKDTELEGFRLEAKPFTVLTLLYQLSALPYWLGLWQAIALHCTGRGIEGEERLFQENDRRRFIVEARIYAAGYVLLLALSVYFESWRLPATLDRSHALYEVGSSHAQLC